MKKIIKEYIVYSFNELSKEAKEKVQDSLSEADADVQTDILNDNFFEQLQKAHPYFNNVKFTWSLNNCQGDGLSFSCDVDINKFLDIKYPNIKMSIYDAICNFLYNVHSNGNTGNYCYCSKSDIDFDYNNYDYEKYPRINKKALEIIEAIQDAYIAICATLEEQGYQGYEYLYSEEYASSICESNEYRFLKDGTMFHV